MSPIVERLFGLLRDKNVKASTVTKELKISASSFTDWKKGRARPGVEVLSKMADYFGVSLDYLITGKEFPEDKRVKARSPETVITIEPEDRDLFAKYQRLPEGCKEKTLIYIDGMLAASQPPQVGTPDQMTASP